MPAKRTPAAGKSRGSDNKRTDKRSGSGSKRKTDAGGRSAGAGRSSSGKRKPESGGRGSARKFESGFGREGRSGGREGSGRSGEQRSRGRSGDDQTRGRAGAGARGRGSEDSWEQRSPRGRGQGTEGGRGRETGRGRTGGKFSEESKFGRAGGDARRKPRFEGESQSRGRYQKRDEDHGEEREFSRRKPAQSRTDSARKPESRGRKQEFEGRAGGRGRKAEFGGREGGRGTGSRSRGQNAGDQHSRGRGREDSFEERSPRGRRQEFEGREGGRGAGSRGRGQGAVDQRGRGRKPESEGYGREGRRDAGPRGRGRDDFRDDARSKRGRRSEGDDFGGDFSFDSGEQHQEDASSSIFGKNAVISYLESLLEARRQESQQEDDDDEDEEGLEADDKNDAGDEDGDDEDADSADSPGDGEDDRELVEIELDLDEEDMEALRQSGFLADEEDLNDDEEEIEEDEEEAGEPGSKSSPAKPRGKGSSTKSKRSPIIRKPDIRKIFLVADSTDEKVRRIENLAGRLRIQVAHVPKAKIDSLTTPGAKHQGVLAKLSPVELLSQGDLLELIEFEKEQIESSGGHLNGYVIVALDGIEDPRNVGAIIRAAEASGARAIILPERRAAGVTETVAKTSAGAVAHIPVAQVTNLVSALSELKELGFWVLGLAADGKDTIYRFDLKRPVVLVIGSEGKGLRPLVSNHCDTLLSIPILGKSESLNASVAAGVALYEVVRQNLK